MFFGMTRGEIGLVVFIFALIYAVRLLPRAGDLLGRLLGEQPGDKESGA
jgi:hypothetical protein